MHDGVVLASASVSEQSMKKAPSVKKGAQGLRVASQARPGRQDLTRGEGGGQVYGGRFSKTENREIRK